MDIPKSDSLSKSVEVANGLLLRGVLLTAKAFRAPFAAKGERPATDNVRLVYEVHSEASGLLEIQQLVKLPAPGFPAPSVPGERGQLVKGTFTHAKLNSRVEVTLGELDVFNGKLQVPFLALREIA
jgi:hypothetical protein